jgi:outer membrane usher protein
LKNAGTLGLAFIGTGGIGESHLLSASWTLSLAHGAFFAATALRDFSSHAVSGEISLSLPLGARGLASVSAGNDNGHLSGLAAYDDPVDADGGFGYRLLAGRQNSDRLEADGDYVGPHLGGDAGLAAANGVVSARADADGALVLLRGSVFAVHDPGDAVALVQTGEPGVRIYRENRPVAVSDSAGEALVTGLTPYAANHIAVEPRDFSWDALVEKTDALVAPPRLGGMLVDFTPASRHPLLARVTRGTALALPVGAPLTLDGASAALPVGHDGEIFVADLEHPTGADVQMGENRCRLWLSPSPGGKNPSQTQDLLCMREADGAY